MSPTGKLSSPSSVIPFWLNSLTSLKFASHSAIFSLYTPNEQNYVTSKGKNYLPFLFLCFKKLNPEMSSVGFLVYAPMVPWDPSVIPLLINGLSPQWCINYALCSKQRSRWWGWGWRCGKVVAARWRENTQGEASAQGLVFGRNWCMKWSRKSEHIVEDGGQQGRVAMGWSVDAKAQRFWESFVPWRKWKLLSAAKGSWVTHTVGSLRWGWSQSGTW